MNCIFCRIASKEVAGKIVYDSDSVIAFDDIAPQAPVHVVIIPKKHMESLEEAKSVLPMIFDAAGEISRIKGVDKGGFRIVLNKGKDAGQALPHIHFHLLGGRILAWPPG